ncbi:hypothetical protein [Campylobacter upsaliensis]|nr:hypothetical protein [Campylobacter upsaliensis]
MRIHKALFEVAGSIHEAQKEVLKELKALSCSCWSCGKIAWRIIC